MQRRDPQPPGWNMELSRGMASEKYSFSGKGQEVSRNSGV